jgi:hypothetical protein
MIMNDCQKIISKAVLFVALVLAFNYNIGQARAVDPEQVTDCTAPTSLDAYVNPFGLVSLKWLHGANTTEFVIQILPAGEVCGSTNVLQEITVPGTASWYTLPTDLSCGFRTLCIKARCCNDRCDACQNLVGKDEDYCSAMSRLYTNRCACKDPNTIPVAGSFRYKCIDANGNTVLQPMPCLIPMKQTGCTWDCNQAAFDGGNKACGVDYEVKCGTGPHGTIVNSQPSYDLCSVFDSRGYKPDDSYLINPPAVFKSPLENRLLYQWGCMGAKPAGESSCFACRRAVCGEAYQNQVVGQDFAKTDLNKLCLSNGENTATATKPVYNSVTKRWEWTCIGNEKCGTNRNGVLSFAEHGNMIYDMADKCSAVAASCGWADKQHVTYETWQKNGGSDGYYAFGSGEGADLGEFWCLHGGRVQNNGWEKSPIHRLGGAYDDSLAWRCVYGEGAQETAVSCSANLTRCRTDIDGKNLTQASFNKYKIQTPNLCDYGKGLYWPFDLLALYKAPELVNNKFAWECKDKFGGVSKCAANEVACKEPPTGSYASSLSDLQAQALCTNGSATAIKTIEAVKKSYAFGWGYWQWYCVDDFGDKAIYNNAFDGQSACVATKLDCAQGPHKGAYENWIAFKAEAGVSCGAVTNDKATCTGVCNKADQSVLVSFNALTKRWNWSCGTETCESKLADCQKPPHEGMYSDLEDFVNKNNGVTCDMANAENGTVRCCGVCSQQGADCSVENYDTGAVNVTWADGKFSWNCGSKSCEAKGKCQPVLAWADDGVDEYCAEKASDDDEVTRTFTISNCASPSPYAYLINTGFNNGSDNTGLKINSDKIRGELIDADKKIWRFTVSFKRQAFGRSRVDLDVGATCNDACAQDVEIKNIADYFAIIANKKADALNLEPQTICAGANRTLTMIGQSSDDVNSADRACDNYQYTWTYEDALGADNAGSWLAPNEAKNYKHIFGRLMSGYSVKAQVRCADEDKCVDQSPASRQIVVEKAKVAESVEIIGSVCAGENLSAEASSASSGCTSFQYRWYLTDAEGNQDNSDWSALTAYPATLSAPKPGDTVKVEAKCVDAGLCTDNAVVSAEQEIKQKIKVEPGSVKIDQAEVCSGANKKLKAVASAPGCQKLEYSWQRNGGLWTDWSETAERNFNPLAPNDKIKVRARCADTGVCVDNTAVMSAELDVTPTKTLNLGEISGYTEALCQQDLGALTLKANVLPSTTCTNISYAWYLNDEETPIASTKDLVAYQFPVGTHQVKLRVTCNDNPCPPEPKTIEKTIEITIDPKVELTMSLSKSPNVEPICAGKEVTINCEADGLPETEKNKLLPIAFAWTWTDALVESKLKVAETNPWFEAWKAKFKLATGTERAEVTTSCAVSTNYRCADPKDLKIEEKIPVIACACGKANGSKHTAAYWSQLMDAADRNAQLCQNGAEAEIIGDPKTVVAGQWKWSCKYPDGTVSPACSATQVSCGELGLPLLPNGSVPAMANKYAPINWTDKLVADLCVGNKSKLAKVTDVEAIKTGYDEVSEDYPTGIQTARKWLCAGDSEEESDQLSCGNLVMDCGYADANRYVSDDKRITPRTGVGNATKYHASFNPQDGGVPVDARCINANNNTYLADGVRGAYTWNCGADTDGVQVNCAARKDCGWTPAVNGEAYPTVYYNEEAGCWTAENVKNPDSADRTMAWHRAVGVADGDFYGANKCGFFGCTDRLLDSSGVTCPAGWSVPINSKWSKLESLLDNNTACVEKRFAPNDWQCNPAAAVKDPALGYGLKSSITFNGKAGEAYWSQTSACSLGAYNDPTGNFCRSFNRQNVTCAGTTKQTGQVLQKTPFFFQLRDDSLIGRLVGGTGWCVPTSVDGYKAEPFIHQLRCVKSGQDTAAIVLPTPTTSNNLMVPCTGLGCYRRR